MKLNNLFEAHKEVRYKDLSNVTIRGKSILLKGKQRDEWSNDLHLPDGVGSLKYSPREIHGSFSCGRLNQITSLEGGPEIVHGNFDCAQLQLTSLEGGPKYVKGSHNKGWGYECFLNKLTSFKGAPEYVDRFNASDNLLTTFEGAPKTINGDFIIYSNKFKTFANIHKHIHTINGSISVAHNAVESHILGLMQIKGLTKISLNDPKSANDWFGSTETEQRFTKACRIVNKHLKSGDIFACQEELEEAGLEEYAQL